jgi:hypothetical protein
MYRRGAARQRRLEYTRDIYRRGRGRQPRFKSFKIWTVLFYKSCVVYTVTDEGGKEGPPGLRIEEMLARHRLVEAGGGWVSEKKYPLLSVTMFGGSWRWLRI